jgi:hypothetical protein
VGPRTGLDAVVRRKKSLPCPFQESNPNLLPCSLVTIVTDLPDHYLVTIHDDLCISFKGIKILCSRNSVVKCPEHLLIATKDSRSEKLTTVIIVTPFSSCF